MVVDETLALWSKVGIGRTQVFWVTALKVLEGFLVCLELFEGFGCFVLVDERELQSEER